MADLIVSQKVPLGDGTVAVTARTPSGEWITVTVGYDKLDTAIMWGMLRAAAAKADAIAASLDARRGKTDHEEEA